MQIKKFSTGKAKSALASTAALKKVPVLAKEPSIGSPAHKKQPGKKKISTPNTLGMIEEEEEKTVTAKRSIKSPKFEVYFTCVTPN